jgi:hypothetical protein
MGVTVREACHRGERREVQQVSRPRRVVVSGSFRRHLSSIQDAVAALESRGVDVLSPSDPRVVDEFGEFLFVASDRMRAIRAVQSRHLAAIRAAEFVWLVAPDGYVGQSASMEIGFALATGTPVYSETTPTDLTLRQYVETVASSDVALRMSARQPESRVQMMLLDPPVVAGLLHERVEGLERRLKGMDVATDEELRTDFREARSMLEFH